MKLSRRIEKRLDGRIRKKIRWEISNEKYFDSIRCFFLEFESSGREIFLLRRKMSRIIRIEVYRTFRDRSRKKIRFGFWSWKKLNEEIRVDLLLSRFVERKNVSVLWCVVFLLFLFWAVERRTNEESFERKMSPRCSPKNFPNDFESKFVSIFDEEKKKEIFFSKLEDFRRRAESIGRTTVNVAVEKSSDTNPFCFLSSFVERQKDENDRTRKSLEFRRKWNRFVPKKIENDELVEQRENHRRTLERSHRSSFEKRVQVDRSSATTRRHVKTTNFSRDFFSLTNFFETFRPLIKSICQQVEEEHRSRPLKFLPAFTTIEEKARSLYNTNSFDELNNEKLVCSMSILPQVDPLPSMFTYVSLQSNFLVRFVFRFVFLSETKIFTSISVWHDDRSLRFDFGTRRRRR